VEPLLIHHHLPKTAGRSLRVVLEENYGPGELLNLTGREEGADLTSWYRSWWQSLPGDERARARCVTSHTAQYLFPVVEERPVRAFCMLREPVERVISLVFFIRWMDEHGKRSPMLSAMRERSWALKDVYRDIGGEENLDPELKRLFWPLFNGQTREVAGPALDWSSPPFGAGAVGLEPLREAASRLLSERYLVGVSERFSESLRLFVDAFSWRRAFVPHVNVRPYGSKRSEVDEETRSLIRAYNAVDFELHAQYLDRVSALPAVRRRDDLEWRARRRGRREVRRARRTAGRLVANVGGVRGGA